MVLIDSPPILPVSDPLVLSRYSDTVLVVAKAGVTSKRSVARAVEMLDQVEARFGGTILNDIPPKLGYDDAYTGYGYSGREQSEYAQPGVRGNGAQRRPSRGWRASTKTQEPTASESAEPPS